MHAVNIGTDNRTRPKNAYEEGMGMGIPPDRLRKLIKEVVRARRGG